MTIVVLVLLFSVQYLGTAKISTVFAPIICIWLLFNAALGFVNLSTYGWGVWQVRILLQGGTELAAVNCAAVLLLIVCQYSHTRPLSCPAICTKRPKFICKPA